MNFPQFTVSRFGYFDSDVDRINKRVGKYRLVAGYELDFYIEDCPGGQDLDGVFYPARRGCVSLARPGQKRALYPPYRCYFINFATQDPELWDLFEQLPTYSELLNMDEAVALFQQILGIEDKTSLEGRLQLQGYVCRLLSLLSQCRVVPAATESSTLRHQKTLLIVDRYIREHLEEDLSLEVLARQANLDPTYFHKLFSAVFGTTPAKRVLSYRISAAKRGLIEGNLPLDELAAKCGFSSQAYFCYKFKKVVGSNPTRYRQIVMNRMKK